MQFPVAGHRGGGSGRRPGQRNPLTAILMPACRPLNYENVPGHMWCRSQVGFTGPVLAARSGAGDAGALADALTGMMLTRLADRERYAGSRTGHPGVRRGGPQGLAWWPMCLGMSGPSALMRA